MYIFPMLWRMFPLETRIRNKKKRLKQCGCLDDIIIIINYDNNGNFFVCFASNVHASMMLNKRKKEKREKKSRINIELRFLLICFVFFQ